MDAYERAVRDFVSVGLLRLETSAGDPLAEHDAMWAYVNLFSDWSAVAEVSDARRAKTGLGGVEGG